MNLTPQKCKTAIIIRGMGTFNCTKLYLAINKSCPISISIVGVAPAHTFVKYEASCGDRGPTLVINPMVRSVAIRERGGGRQFQYFDTPKVLPEIMLTMI